ncbi:hypothetical protein KKH82_06105 [Patescibacteria group bacterium]|nr:hypothetical protein [Patescibacteria group bacterium]
MIAKDDYMFYQAMIKLRNKEYKAARDIFNQIHTPYYQESIQSITQAIAQYDTSKTIPKEYQDGLVALSLLKNGYFSVAKKIALETALKDKKYILPYQILAYTHFLTNNRETASEYFLKLADVDATNQSLYKFLIGICNYRTQDYRKAILYLSQTTDPELQTDTYRYLINSYIQENDIQNAVSTRQKLLGQNDINESDFYHYFYQALYMPYLQNKKAEIYEANTLLTEMYINSCSTTLSGSDVCTFGQIGQKIITSDKLSGF